MGSVIRGQVSVSAGNNRMLAVSGLNTGTALMPPGGTTTGGTGSYIESLIIFPLVLTTVGSCGVFLGDNNTGTVTILNSPIAGTTTQMTYPLMIQVWLGVTSQMGPWRLTLQGNVGVTVIGRFEK